MFADWTLRHFAAEDLITWSILLVALLAALGWQAWENWKQQ